MDVKLYSSLEMSDSFLLFSCILLIVIPKGLSTLYMKRMWSVDYCSQYGGVKLRRVVVDGFPGLSLWPGMVSLIR